MSDQIAFDDFTKVDIRVGTIIEVTDFEKARNSAYKLKVDFGSLGVKNSSAQITKLYSKEALLNRQVAAVINFIPKIIAGYHSECLVLGIENDNQEVVLLQTTQQINNGTPIN